MISGFAFFLSSLFYLGLIYHTLIIPSKALTQVSPLQLRLQSREPSCHQSSGDISGHGVLFFVSLFAFCLPITYLPTNDLRPDGYCDFLNFAPFHSCTLVC
ncbi:hypothetical protein BO83DRAFT_44974 [Aspergillus eucalypticola CBS 122712]|uniref:Uncharacterized protein n=1 Tax=Aspergillus eucalypticola (strain CBS 122712 / IBT 29274) TaxID=1448314 RepID=A0A317VFF8_ASPEC|nr:uncharacterized protein BO83DRAFT_44974 [Aspergillus eucalypticola CBS 122712]PWY71951.1 hypothetical protein BO83DRAFT_44974 [Aspergillus eucalypticola CBS 122712]